MGMTVIVIVGVVLVAAVAVLIWYFTGRRPARLDPRSERLVESLIQLQRDNPRKAAEVFSRALVRAGLVWEKDLLGSTSAAPNQSNRPDSRDYRRDQRQQRPPVVRSEQRGDQRNDQRGHQQSAGQRPEVRDQRPADVNKSAVPGADRAEAPSQQPQPSQSSRRRRRRRPSGNREPGAQQTPEAPPQQTQTPPANE